VIFSLGLALTLVTIGAEAAAGNGSATPEHAYAIIVANNLGLDPGMPRLRYADDDGARYLELLSLITQRAELLAVLDEDTQQIHPKAAEIARPPNRASLLSTIESVFADIDRDQKAGIRTTFYFVYAGHGSVGDDGEGAMHLLDGRFTRADLFHHIISKTPARMNHIIIDACDAYLMVARRGGGGKAPSEKAINDAVSGFLSKEGLEHYPNVGVLLSTSRAADVHEWSRFSAGIFSHEVRSALAGAADITGDGEVSYDEVRAFLSAANGRVQDPRAHLHAYALAPAIRHAEPLFNRALAKNAPTVVVPGTLAGHRYLEDARGVRYADLNVGKDGAVNMVLVPSSVYFLRSEREEIKLPMEAMTSIDAGQLPRSDVAIAQRGAEALTFQRDLFMIPFGRAYLDGFMASAPIDPTPELVTNVVPETGFPVRRMVAIGSAAGAVASAAVGVWYGIQAQQASNDYMNRFAGGTDVEGKRTSAGSYQQTANILYGVAGGLTAAAALLWFWPSD
jgi:hypothetical protein